MESVIPVSIDDYYNKEDYKKYSSLASYNKSRDAANVAPLSEDGSYKILHKQTNELEQESIALAYQYAKQSEQIKEKQNGYWASLMKLTN